MEGLSRSPLALFLRLLGDVEGEGVQELDEAAHLILHHLLEGLLLSLNLIVAMDCIVAIHLRATSSAACCPLERLSAILASRFAADAHHKVLVFPL